MDSSESKRLSHDDIHFGDDQILEIFSRMPAKAVIKCSSLSKSLSTLIFSDMLFRQRQTIHSSLTDGGVFIQGKNCRDLMEFHALPGEGEGDAAASSSTIGLPTESLSFLQKQCGVILASSQGLVLVLKFPDRYKIYEDAPDLVICNPATRSWAPLAFPEWLASRDYVDWGASLLECHPSCYSDYSVVIPTWIEEEESDPWSSSYNLAVYRNGRWEEEMCELRIRRHDKLRLDMPVGLFREGGLVVHYLCESYQGVASTRPLYTQQPMPLNGFNWKRLTRKDIWRPMYKEPYMVAYDMDRKGLSRRFKLPEDAWKGGDGGIASHLELHMFKWSCRRWRWRSSTSAASADGTVGLARIDQTEGGCLFTVWVLEDYEGGSWRRVIRKTAQEMGLPTEEVVEGMGVLRGCCVANGRGVVFATARRVYMYDMEAGRLQVVTECDYEFEFKLKFTLYANTLRPVCGRRETITNTLVKRILG